MTLDDSWMMIRFLDLYLRENFTIPWFLHRSPQKNTYLLRPSQLRIGHRSEDETQEILVQMGCCFCFLLFLLVINTNRSTHLRWGKTSPVRFRFQFFWCHTWWNRAVIPDIPPPPTKFYLWTSWLEFTSSCNILSKESKHSPLKVLGQTHRALPTKKITWFVQTLLRATRKKNRMDFWRPFLFDSQKIYPLNILSQTQ